jgi:hypothetical protein
MQLLVEVDEVVCDVFVGIRGMFQLGKILRCVGY